MGLNAIAFFIVCSVICESLGDIQLSCDTVDPMQPSKIKCTCRNKNGAGILWIKNNVYMADCYLKHGSCMSHKEYSVSVNSSEKKYMIEKGGYNYSSCNVYTCGDMHQPEIKASMRIGVQNSTSISALNISEPTTNHTSGFIGVTTECIYGASSEVTDLDIQWLVVMGSVEKSFNPMKTTIKTHNGSCQLCDGDKATQFIIGFYHKEEMGCQRKEAKFRIILWHNNISSEPLNITTRNFYCVSDQTADGSTSRWSIITTILIVNVIFQCLLLQYILLVLMCIQKRRKRNTNPAGKMRSDSTKLRLQDKLPKLALVPVLGIVVIIAYCYTCCSCTDTEEPCASVVSEENTEKGMKLLTETGRKQPDNMNDVCTSFVPHKDDKTKDNDSDEGYKSKSSTSSTEISQDAN